jgi:hypothetical protein|nr:MAG TPA: hypothetical protein [Caudoviricetes sp.]
MPGTENNEGRVEFEALLRHGDTGAGSPADTAEIVEVKYGDGE